jgi:2-polyprenyl-6-methoxyphenol hydroxylase-like FAD-dependent oxidoreductase
MTGDLLLIECNALHTVKKWPGFFERLEAISYKTQRNVKKFDGTWIGGWPIGDGENKSAAINRSELHGLLWDYVQGLGINVDFDKAVDEYFESDTHGGVVLQDGQKVTADIVVAADGVGSKSWPLVLGQKDKPISSGFACYRATFPASPALENPIIAKEFEGHVNRSSLHLGPGAHMVVGKTNRQICYILTHRVCLMILLFRKAMANILSCRMTTTPRRIGIRWCLPILLYSTSPAGSPS